MENSIEAQIAQFETIIKNKVSYLVDRVYADDIANYNKDNIYNCFEEFVKKLSEVESKLS